MNAWRDFSILKLKKLATNRENLTFHSNFLDKETRDCPTLKAQALPSSSLYMQLLAKHRNNIALLQHSIENRTTRPPGNWSNFSAARFKAKQYNPVFLSNKAYFARIATASWAQMFYRQIGRERKANLSFNYANKWFLITFSARNCH